MSFARWLAPLDQWSNGKKRQDRRKQKANGHYGSSRPWLETLEWRLAPAITLSISNPAPFPKGDSGTSLGMFVVTRSGDLSPAVQVDFATRNGTAHAGSDYEATSGTLYFAPNQTTATISVPIIGNTLFEPSKTFTVALSSPLPSATFAAPQPFATGNFPGVSAVGDFSGDGKLDLAVANTDSNSISVLLNTTSPGATVPSFSAPQVFAAGDRPVAVAVGDFNGDGKLDLAVVNTFGDTVSVLLNTTAPGSSTLSFAAQQTFATGAGPVFVAIADFNGDGRPDLAIANERDHTVSVLANTTAPEASVASFSAPQTFATGANPVDLAVADFNGDGKPDLAVANYDRSNTVSVLLNTTPTGATTASFAAQQTFATGTNPSSLTVADFNGDGKPDVAVANFSDDTVSVLLNTTPPGTSSASFAAQQTFATGSRPAMVRSGDFNGDGKPDLVIADSGSNTVSVLLNETMSGASAPRFAPQQTFPAGNSPFGIVVADFNNDGLPDVAVGNNSSQTGQVYVLLNARVPVTGGLGFTRQQTFATGNSPDAVAVADLNGDGKPDLVVCNYIASSVSILLNTTPPGASTPSFATQQTFVVGRPRALAVGDLNGDGSPDLAIADEVYGTVTVLLNTTAPGASSVSFAPPQTFPTGHNPEGVAIADFNGDGKPDLAVTNGSDNTVSILLNTTAPGATTASFAPQQVFASSPAGDSTLGPVAVGDFNGDGKPDLAVASGEMSGYAGASVLLNTTAPGSSVLSFTAPQFFFTGKTCLSLAVGDLNGDGRPDIAETNYSLTGSMYSEVDVLVNTTAPGASSPSFAFRQRFNTSTRPRSVAMGDFNNDGRLDLAVANVVSNSVSVLLNSTVPGSSTVTLAAKQDFGAGRGPNAVAVGDFNGDGKPDFAVINGQANSVSVLLNSSAPIVISGSPATGTIQSDDNPASIVIAAGNNQSTQVNTSFPTNLAVDVQGADSDLLQGVSVTFTAPASGASGTFPGGRTSVTVVTNASGVATAPTFTANGTAGSYMVVAQAAGGSNRSVSFSLTNTAGVGVTHFSVSAPSSTTAGSPFDVTVSALDASNQVVTSYTGTIHFTTSDGNHVLPMDYTFVAGDSGVHTFMAGVTLRTAGSQTVSVNDTVNTSLTGSATVSVSPGAADHLAFGQQPSNTAVNASIAPRVTVQIEDAFNNVLTGDNADQITIAIGTNPSGGTLSGTNPVTVSGGIATFSNLSINQVGNGYTLTASSGSLMGATSASFNITSGATTTTIEGFESGNLSAYTVVGGTKPTALVNSASRHDGNFGLLDSNGTDWIFRNDSGAHVQQGDRISVWLQFNTAANGQANFGFGATSTGTYSIVAAPGTNVLQIQLNPGFTGTPTVLGTVSQTYLANHWYRLQVDWGSTGTITGTLFDSDGVTQLNTVSGSSTAITSGGIAFHATGANSKYWDTVQRTPGVDVAGHANDLIQLGLSPTNNDGSNPSYRLPRPFEQNMVETGLLHFSAVVRNQPVDLARVLLARSKANWLEARDALFVRDHLFAGLTDVETALKG